MSATTDQRHRALERANHIRLERAELRRRIARGELRAATVISDPPEAALSWPLYDVLIAQRGWGETRVRKLIWRNGLPDRKTLGALTTHQRQVIANALGERP
jgi:hypothetical protein